jgi:glycosyltransferase involved in cell wall biosynthesis
VRDGVAARRWDIVCLAGMDWDENWTSRQQIMSRLAQKHRVLYVERSRSPFTRFSGVLGGKSARSAAPHRVSGAAGGELVILRPPFRLPMPYHPVVNRISSGVLRSWLRRRVRRLQWSPDVLWTFAPETAPVIGSLGERISVYHCVDEHAAYARLNPRFAWARPAHDIRNREREVLARVKLVLASSPTLTERIARNHPATHYLPHGADVSVYGRAVHDALPEPVDLAALPHPRAGFVGMIDGRLDTQLMARLATAMPTWSFVFVGEVRFHTDGLATLQKLPNVHFLRFKPLAELPAYVRGLDVATIPYRHDAFTSGIFPLKLFEYLGAGKGVVATRLPSLTTFEQDGLLHLASDAPSFERALIELARRSSSDAQRRVELASRHTWEQRVADIEQLVAVALSRRV